MIGPITVVPVFPRPVDGTPVEQAGADIWVKREDLCCPYPGPQFSKIRGCFAHIEKRPEKTIGVLDTFHSKGGWAVSYVCAALGKQALDFFPLYKRDNDTLRVQQAEALRLGAHLEALPAGRSAVLYHKARREAETRGGYMMPNALKLPETVEECAAEVVRTPELARFKTLVLSVSSGTIAAGVLRGFDVLGLQPIVILHMGYSRSETVLWDYVAGHCPAIAGWRGPISIVDEGYEYKDAAPAGTTAPFPCNPHYDLKAWRWLNSQAGRRLPGPTLFWNVGS